MKLELQISNILNVNGEPPVQLVDGVAQDCAVVRDSGQLSLEFLPLLSEGRQFVCQLLLLDIVILSQLKGRKIFARWINSIF